MVPRNRIGESAWDTGCAGCRQVKITVQCARTHTAVVGYVGIYLYCILLLRTTTAVVAAAPKSFTIWVSLFVGKASLVLSYFFACTLTPKNGAFSSPAAPTALWERLPRASSAGGWEGQGWGVRSIRLPNFSRPKVGYHHPKLVTSQEHTWCAVLTVALADYVKVGNYSSSC